MGEGGATSDGENGGEGNDKDDMTDNAANANREQTPPGTPTVSTVSSRAGTVTRSSNGGKTPEGTGVTRFLRKRKREAQPPTVWRETDGTLLMSDLVNAASNAGTAKLIADEPSRLRAPQSRPSRKVVLPPITLNFGSENKSIPESLQGLPPTQEVDIFDRKTGRILRGHRAVQIRHLATMLRDHPEYEPIVPPVQYTGKERRYVGGAVCAVCVRTRSFHSC